MQQARQNPIEENNLANAQNPADVAVQENLQQFVNKEYRGVNERLQELDREWDVDRALELNAAAFALTGLVLGAFVNKRWLAVPFLVTGFLIQQATMGWCPPVPVLRRFGLRSRAEIDKEKFALKALRGDFRRTVNNPAKAWKAVKE